MERATPHETPTAERAEALAPTRRMPGRPKGVDYRTLDAPLHEEMRLLLERREVISLTAAAWAVVDRAYPGKHTKDQSKVTRLVRTYPYPYPP